MMERKQASACGASAPTFFDMVNVNKIYNPDPSLHARWRSPFPSYRKTPLEELEHLAFVDWLRWKHIDFFHVANEAVWLGILRRVLGQEAANKAARKIIAKLKRMGMVPGVHDFVILTKPPGKKYRFVTVEMKSEKGRATKSQQEFTTIVEKNGGIAFVAKGAGKAIEFMEGLGY